MKTTSYLSLEYGGLTYDGGQELIAGRNLDKIEAELVRLADLAGSPADLAFRRGAFTYDAGQEKAARENLEIIEAEIKRLIELAEADIDFALDKSLAATDGGTPAAMARNLILIDETLEQLNELLDEGGDDGPYTPPAATGDWSTGAGTIVITVERRAIDLGFGPRDTAGFMFIGVPDLGLGSAQNFMIGELGVSGGMLQRCYAQEGSDDPESPDYGRATINIAFTDRENPPPSWADMAGRTMRLYHNGQQVWEGSPDGSVPAWMKPDSMGPGTVVIDLPDGMPNWQDGDYLVLEIDAP